MLPVAQSQVTFQSGNKPIRLDAYLPEASGAPLPAVIALYGSGGNVSGMERYAGTLAAEGFAVYLLHYFDRTGTESADKPTILRNFPTWMKTLWDAVSFVKRSRTWIVSASLCSAFRSEPTCRSRTPPSTLV